MQVGNVFYTIVKVFDHCQRIKNIAKRTETVTFHS